MSLPPHTAEEPELSVMKRLTADQRKMDWRRKKHIERMDQVPTRFTKMLGWAGWGSAIVIVGWMALYEDFGQTENVFTDLRKSYRSFMKSTFNLTPQEKSLLSIVNSKESKDPNDFIKKLDQRVGIDTSTRDTDLVNDGKPS